MSDRDWDAELKKIDAAMAKESSRPAPPAGAAPAPQAAASAGAPRAAAPVATGPLGLPAPQTTGFGVYLRLMLAVAVGVGIVFWPYTARCGLGLAAYLGAVGTVVVSGAWSAVWTFRHRAGRAHVLSLLLVLWGLVLASLDVLPRIGYAIPTADHPATWSCEA
ncbi:MAG: hypothetical protein KF709_12250 [Gemmatimonadaceae bacterium]|nr:hypothetical protein [Gemmatimonadaceae bacterium]